MAYCTNCGNYIEDGAKFCGHCGAKMEPNPVPQSGDEPRVNTTRGRSNRRETVYEGEVHKCPNCGTTLAAFVKSCPECGYELRGAAGTYSVEEFGKRYASAKNNSQKIDLIRTYVIPNTKEDILEFVILASSNIDADSYTRHGNVVSGGVSQQDLTEAWMAKFEQAYQKANLMLTDDPYLEKINTLYSSKKKALGNARTKSFGSKVIGAVLGNDFVKSMSLFIIIMLLLGAIGGGLLGGFERKLEKQVKQIEAYIAEENYDSALTTAYAMSDDYSNSWSETRESLINRILELQGKANGASNDHEGMVRIPSQSLSGKQADDVVSIFTAAGFTNVKKEPLKGDLLTGWLDKLVETTGSVAEISVNGQTSFTSGSWVAPDVPVIVRYYK